ncbi:MAG: formimidoylglutamate deiminase [Myxococcota bacterium]
MVVVEPEWCLVGEELRRDVALTLDGGVVAAIGPATGHGTLLPGRLALPGLVNAHSHAFQRAFRGHVQWRETGRDDFWSWRDRMYAVANGLTPDGIEAVSALAFLEMALAGITRVGEFHYLHHQPDGAPYADPDELAHRVLAAAAEVGLGITLLRVAYLRSTAGAPLRPDQRRFGDRDADAVLAAVDRLTAATSRADGVRIGLAPHSVRAVDRDSLRRLASFGGIVHAHVSEQPAENATCLAENGASPLAVLDDAGVVTQRFSAVHLTFPLEGDLERLVRAGASVCVCPSTELDLGDGFLPVAVREAARMCIGSDSHAVIDPLGEARTLELHARALAGRRNVLAPETPAGSDRSGLGLPLDRSGLGLPLDRSGLARRILAAATTEGDRALGGAGLGIAVGAPADLCVLDLRRVAADGVPPLEAAAFVAGPEWVESVWVGGRPIVDRGHHPRADAIRARARPFLG